MKFRDILKAKDAFLEPGYYVTNSILYSLSNQAKSNLM